MTEEKETKTRAPSLSFFLALLLVFSFLAGFAWTLGEELAIDIVSRFEEPLDLREVCPKLGWAK